MAEKRVSEPVEVPPDATDSLDSTEPAETASEPAPADSSAELKRERDDYHDRWLRKSAEFDNYRKRIERERREQSDQAVVGLLQDLLAVVDDFDLALTVEAAPEADGYRKGVELIHAKLHDFLKKRGVTPIESVGEDFDPNIHQAVMHEVSPDHREGEVIGELRKGYMLGDRLLRPAMVRVAKA
jgi:molecular chaperone GrpE